MIDVAARLTDPGLPVRLARLGFRDDDRLAALAAAGVVAASDPALARVATLAELLLSQIGDFALASSRFEDEGSQPHPLGVGVLPLLAMVVTAPEVVTFAAHRDIADDIAWGSLADLGQQAWVHRQTYGEFGLHTYPWMQNSWSGALYRLGRLQFNLQPVSGEPGDEWVLSTHISATGPLAPGSVDDSFRRAVVFFAEHFADYPTTDFFCSSWLLDPELAAALAPGSNLVNFQQRWRLYGEPMRGDRDAIFFTFFRRGDVDLASLPRQTTLQRAVIDRLRAGRHWSIWQGRIPQSTVTADRIEAHP